MIYRSVLERFPPLIAPLSKLSLCTTVSKAQFTTSNTKRQQAYFHKAELGAFSQEAPKLENLFTADVTLQRALQRVLPLEHVQPVCDDLTRFGERICNELQMLHAQCEAEPPQLQHFDAWGRRIDRLVTSPAWRSMKNVSAEEGLIAIGYERNLAEFSRLYQFSKNYMFSSTSGLYSCPLAMTDGAAKIIESLGKPVELVCAYNRLTSRDPELFWTSGQWMTEKRGGSDVARGTETRATRQSDGSYLLHGFKWFTSATDAQMSFALARCVTADGSVIEGTKGLSLFYIELEKEDGSSNGLQPQRLKNKLGTRQLPTAEMLLDGCRALRVSEEGRGVSCVADMLSLTRLHTSVMSLSLMRKMQSLCRDYTQRRSVFGKRLDQHSLHMKTLAAMEVECRAALLLLLELSRLLGREECGQACQAESQLLRLLTPLAKLYTAKQAVSVCSEGLESIGGQGYIEDTGLPAMLRDAQVMPIWEGTTNVLSLDVLRALDKSCGESLAVYMNAVQERVQRAPEALAETSEKLVAAARSNIQFATHNVNLLEIGARDFALGMARIFMGALLVEHASAVAATETDILTAKRFCEQDLTPVVNCHMQGALSQTSADLNYALVLEGYARH